MVNTPMPFFCENEICTDILLEGRVGSYHHNIPVRSPWLVSSSPSGAYTVIALDLTGNVSDESDMFAILQLLHFTNDPPNIQPCQLELPFFIDLNDICSIALDERRGIVYLSHARGYLFAVPYA